MVRYDRNAFDKSPVTMRYAVMFLPIHRVNYWILLKIFPVNSKRQMNFVHILACILLYIEMFLILASWKVELLYSLKYHIGAVIVELIILVDIFYFLPYWIDDDIADICERPSDLYQGKENLDPFAIVADKEVTNIQIVNNIAQQSSRNTGGKNTEITVNVVSGLDLNNKTIILPQKPKQSNQDNEQ